MSLPDVAYPHLQELVDAVRESSSVSVLDGDEIVDVARVPAKRIMTVAVPGRAPGSAPTPAQRAGSSWRACPQAELELATWRRSVSTGSRARPSPTPIASAPLLAAVRAQGYAIVDQEVEEGIRSVAVPLRDASGVTVAAINVSAYASRASVDAVRNEFLPSLFGTRQADRGRPQARRGLGRG